MQSKTNIDPTSSSQTITADSGFDGLSSVQINPIPSQYIIPTGTISISQNGTVDVSAYANANINVSGSSGNGTAIITDTTDTAGGTIRTITTTNEVHLQTKTITPTSSQQTVLPDTGYDGFSSVIVGASSGGTPSATQHTIHLEFSDSTSTNVPVYYDDSFLGTMIRNNEFRGKLYNNKTISLAQLDGVTWYEAVTIPLNTQLIDYTTIKADYVVSETNGEEVSQQWGSCTGYIPIDPSMTFSYLNYRWTSMVFYDINKDYIRSLYTDNDKDSVDGNDMATGTLNSSKIPPSAYYIRMNCPYMADSSSQVSLIRTA